MCDQNLATFRTFLQYVSIAPSFLLLVFYGPWPGTGLGSFYTLTAS